MGRAAGLAGLVPCLGFAAILVSTLGLAGCSDLDNQLFPEDASAPAKPATTADNSSNASTSNPDETAQPAPPANSESPSTTPEQSASNESPSTNSEQPQPESSQEPATNEQPNSAESSSDQTFLDRLFGSDESDQGQAPQPTQQQNAEEPSSGGSWLDSLFGSDETEQPQYPAPSGQTAQATNESPGYAPTGGGVNISPRESAIHPINIEGGQDTGTSVNKTVQSLRSQTEQLEQKMLASAARTKELRDALKSASSSYVSETAGIIARLQLGTTRGNPELVSSWNSAQSKLDELAGHINALASLGTSLNSDVSTSRQLAGTIASTYYVSGAVDEDHRQLGVVRDEEAQVFSATDRIFRAVSNEVRRQTAFVGVERINLARLESSIKNGDPYVAGGGGVGTAMSAVPSGEYSVAMDSGKPFIVIRFDRPDVDYQEILLSALKEALKTRPNASFRVVGIAPPARSARAVAAAQSTARKHAQDVLQSMTGMGVPATRLQVAAITDPAASATEVRIFVL